MPAHLRPSGSPVPLGDEVVGWATRPAAPSTTHGCPGPFSSVCSQHRFMTFLLLQKIKMFNQDIEKLAEGEDVVKEEETRLINKLREEFINWALVLEAGTQDGKSGTGLPLQAVSYSPRPEATSCAGKVSEKLACPYERSWAPSSSLTASPVSTEPCPRQVNRKQSHFPDMLLAFLFCVRHLRLTGISLLVALNPRHRGQGSDTNPLAQLPLCSSLDGSSMPVCASLCVCTSACACKWVHAVCACACVCCVRVCCVFVHFGT